MRRSPEELKRRLDRALQQLPEIDRIIVRNRIESSRKKRETAEFLFCTPERVKKRYQRAGKQLRQLVREMPPE